MLGNGSLDKNKLVQDFMTLLSAMEQAVGETGHQAPEGRGQSGASAFAEFADLSAEEARFANATLDSFSSYDELVLDDGRVLRRYDSGSVRVENPKSGVIQEERPDGSLVVSLPSGKVLFQEFRGEPLLVYDTDRGGPPGLARVSSAQLPDDSQLKFVFHFQDYEGAHLVELESLRYYRISRQPMAAGG
ncbi:MAG: hypothetical protein HY319_22200 [Armatimonadetes bacterium]|nr:hypothetical protein [Armatimonadota bacterium]